MNMISEEKAYQVKDSLDHVEMSMIQVWKALVEPKMIRSKRTRLEARHGVFCEFHWILKGTPYKAMRNFELKFKN